MPEQKTLERAKAAKRQGKSPSTQASAFVKEQIDHVRAGRHGVRSTKQAIAIGLSQARRAGVAIPDKPTQQDGATKSKASQSLTSTQSGHAKAGTGTTHKKRADASLRALKREDSAPVSRAALARQAGNAAGHRSAAERSASAKQGARTKGKAGRSAAARKAAQTRAATHH